MNPTPDRLALIRKVQGHLHRTSRQVRYRPHRPKANALIKIRRGYYLDASILEQAADLIEQRLIIFLAQCIAACDLSPDSISLTHEAALVFLGIPTLRMPDQIRMSYQERRWRLRASFPRVTFQGQVLSPPRVARFHRNSISSRQIEVAGIRLSPPGTILLDLALQGTQRSAFASACLFVRRLIGAQSSEPETTAQRMHEARDTLLRLLKNKTCCTSKKIGRAFCQHLDPRVESLPEATMVWDLHRNGAKAWELQYPVNAYRADVCFPSERVIIEIEGASKLGKLAKQRDRSAAKLITRSSKISTAGFRVIAVSAYDQMYRPGVVLTELFTQAPEIFTSAPGAWWCQDQKPTFRFERKRHFHKNRHRRHRKVR